MGLHGGSAVKNPPTMQELQETQVQSLDWEDTLAESIATHSSILAWSGREHSNPLQYSCLENPMDRGAWWATVHRIAELDTTCY